MARNKAGVWKRVAARRPIGAVKRGAAGNVANLDTGLGCEVANGSEDGEAANQSKLPAVGKRETDTAKRSTMCEVGVVV